MTSTRGVNPGPANNPALLYHCRTQLQQRLTGSTKRKGVKVQIIERGIVRNSSPEDELPDAWQHKVQQHQRPQLPLPTERRSWWKLTARSAKLFIFLPFLSLFFFSLLLWQSANAQKRANHSPVIIVKLQNKQTCWNRNYSMKATHIYIQERQKPFRYFCDDPVQETCKQFDFLNNLIYIFPSQS